MEKIKLTIRLSKEAEDYINKFIDFYKFYVIGDMNMKNGDVLLEILKKYLVIKYGKSGKKR